MSSNLSSSSTIDYELLCERCEEFIRHGNLQVTRDLLSNLNHHHVPRRFKAYIARTYRRIGYISEGLRVLKKIIFNQIPGESKATPIEQCEYAVLLSRIGSIDEAMSILKKINPQKNSDVYLYYGFCLVSKWNYTEANHEFQKSIQFTEDPYLRSVAQVNLAASLILAKQYTEAIELLSVLIEKEARLDNRRLLGNCFELRAQAYFHLQLISNAESDLTAAFQILQHTNAYDEVLVRKWHAIIESYKQNSINPLFDFKAYAINKAHWESVRDIDFYMLKMNFNQDKFDYIYFGTPYDSFRSRMINEIQAQPSSRFFLGDPQGVEISLVTGKYGSQDTHQMSQKLQSLILALVGDFYLPISIGNLFSKIYPKEHFDIESSPIKVRQIISRLRKWFLENNANAKIHQINGGYKLEFQRGLGVVLLQEQWEVDGLSRNFARLLQIFSAGSFFTIQDVELKLGLSRSDFHRTARWALENHKLIKIGKGKSTRYQIIAA